jgi:hypothetical protein
MDATLVTMPKRKKNKDANQSQRQPTTDVVRIDADLARKIRVIALAEDRPASDILSERLRSFIDHEFPKALKKLAEREHMGRRSDSSWEGKSADRLPRIHRPIVFHSVALYRRSVCLTNV